MIWKRISVAFAILLVLFTGVANAAPPDYKWGVDSELPYPPYLNMYRYSYQGEKMDIRFDDSQNLRIFNYMPFNFFEENWYSPMMTAAVSPYVSASWWGNGTPEFLKIEAEVCFHSLYGLSASIQDLGVDIHDKCYTYQSEQFTDRKTAVWTGHTYAETAINVYTVTQTVNVTARYQGRDYYATSRVFVNVTDPLAGK